ncbi:MAG TPA: LEA type 2 family protein [Gemmatimonadales bacterium]|nr:LEA type 2 family protein [Gemmatimonadales bacterium]
MSGWRPLVRAGRPLFAGRRGLVPVAAVLVACTAACATLAHLSFHEPELALQEIDLRGIGLTGGTLDLVFDVYNPNDYRIRSTRIEVGIDLEDTHFGDALLERPLDLSPTNHSRVVVPVRFEWAGAGVGAKALLTKQTVGYGVTGRVFLDTPLGDQTVALAGRGTVPLRKLLK